jgi:hypothetical protein
MDHIIGLLLLGLGIKSQVNSQAVKGDTTEMRQEVNTRSETPEASDDMQATNKNELERDTKARSLIATITPYVDTRHMTKLDIEAFKAQIKKEQEQSKTELETKKTKFKEELQVINDARKKEILQRLETNFKTINDKRVAQMTEQLGKLQQILDKVIARAIAAKQTGKNTTNVDAMTLQCQTNITAAQAAVTAQSGHTYTIEISTESEVKSNVGTTRQTFELDMKSVNTAMKKARSCLYDAITELAKISGEKVGTGSGTGSSHGEPTGTVPPAVERTPTPGTQSPG